MLLQSLRALCKAPGGAGSIWEYLDAVVRATRVSGRFAYSFRTGLHFADHAASPPPCHWVPSCGNCHPRQPHDPLFVQLPDQPFSAKRQLLGSQCGVD